MNQVHWMEGKGAAGQHDLLAVVLKHSLNAVVVTASDSTIEYVNPAFERMTGYSWEEAVGQRMSLLKSGETPREVYQDLWDTVRSGRTWRGMLKNRRRDGSIYLSNNVISPILDDRGRVTRFLAVQEDMTARVAEEDEQREARRRDPLTGLLHRQGFIEALERAVREVLPGQSLSLILLDLDSFRLVNETYGHGTGDRVLARVAAVLREGAERSGAVLGALGGDEFAAILGRGRDPMEVAKAMCRSIEDFRPKDLPAWVTVSAGVAVFPEDASTASGLLARADAAVGAAKARGHGQAHRYLPQDRKEARSRLRELDAIRKALAEGRFVPYFQPILDIEARAIRHFEALARMVRPDGTVASPAEFIETAERFHVVREIDRAIARRAMEVQAEWRRGGRSITISTNLSGRDIGDEDLLDYLRDAAAETGAQPTDFVFEITETEAIRDLEKAWGVQRALSGRPDGVTIPAPWVLRP